MQHLRWVAVAMAVMLLAVPAAAVAAPAEPLEPEQLPRGAAVRVPHVEGRTVVDGDRRIDINGKYVTLLASGPAGYVVRAAPGLGTVGRILLVRPGGQPQKVRGVWFADDVTFSDDGQLFAQSTLLADDHSLIEVRRTRDGRLVASREFVEPDAGATIIEVSEDRLLFGRSRSGRVHLWDLKTGRLRQMADQNRKIYAGDLRLGLLAAFTTRGRRCSVVVPIADPDRVLWRSCRERVLAFSPDGRRMATTRKATDPSLPDLYTMRYVGVRTLAGRLLGGFTARSFRDVRWESDTRLLLDTAGTTTTAIVRCVAGRCRTATEPATLTVKPGRHVLLVRAVGPMGRVDPTPVQVRWTTVRSR
jgi:WD40 repeat protein